MSKKPKNTAPKPKLAVHVFTEGVWPGEEYGIFLHCVFAQLVGC